MSSCRHCQAPLADPLPAQCPYCGGVLGAADAAPPPLPPAVVEATPPAGPPPLPPLGLGSAAGGARPEGGGIPWDARDRIGLAQAFVETARQVLAAPTSFFRAMPVTGGVGSPLLFAVVAGWIGLAAAAFYQAIWVSIVGPTTLPFGLDREELGGALAFMESWVGLVSQVVFGGVWVVVSVFLAAGIIHLMLLLLGGARRGFEATFRVVCFSQATALLFVVPLFLVPFCGLALVLWCLVLYVIGLAAAHQIGHGQALAAVLLPLVALCCCCAGLAATFAGAIASLAGHVP